MQTARPTASGNPVLNNTGTPIPTSTWIRNTALHSSVWAVAVLGVQLIAGCAVSVAGGDEDQSTADAGCQGSSCSDQSSADASAPAPDPDAGELVGCEAVSDPSPCATKDGLQVYCLDPSESVTVKSAATYPAGASIMAMGVGSIVSSGTMIGYILASDPFTCEPQGCANAVGTGNSGAGGKICEVDFDLELPEEGNATAAYTITADSAPASGDYLMGFQSSSGSQVSTPNFWLRIQPDQPEG